MSLADTRLGRYRLLQQIGKGGMGEVYLAVDDSVQRQVAIKVIRSEQAIDPGSPRAREAERLFQREAHAIASLDHAHILPLFDYGEQHESSSVLTYMVMPYRQEGTLKDWLREHASTMQLPLPTIVAIVQQAASALQYAHQQQIIHQDVKPANFLIRANREQPQIPDLLLADFGIARIIAATSQTSQQMRGTPVYMAPEHWQGEPVFASDQYSLAVMAYELLTGQLPFQGNLGQLMFAHAHNYAVPPSQLNPTLSQELDAVVLRALAKRPEERFPSVSEFALAFQQAVGTNPYNTVFMPDTHQLSATQEVPYSATSWPSSMNYPATHSTPMQQTPPYLPSYQPQPQPIETRRSRLPLLLTGVALLVLLVGGGLFAFHPWASTHPQGQQTPSITTQGAPYPTGKLVLDDPLQNNARGYQWRIATDDYGNCGFAANALHVVMTLPGVEYCYSKATTYTNFTYQVEMHILQGNEGGVIFRSLNADQNFYYCALGQDGSYRIVVYTGQSSSATATLTSGNSTAIHRGLNQSNLLTVVASGDQLDLYINQQHVATVHDQQYKAGYVGVAVHSDASDLSAITTEVAFSNAKLWIPSA